MFFKILDNIRRKPARVRSMYALVISVGITLVIAGVWLIGFAGYISDATKDNFVEKSLEPIHKLSEVVQNGYTRIKNLKGAFLGTTILDTAILSTTTVDTSATSTALSNTETSSTSAEELIQ